MLTLESIYKYRTESENEAKEVISNAKKDADEKGYYIKKAGYEYKTKKSKGEIIDECYVVTIDTIRGEVWA